VINLLEDALYNGRLADINKLYNASEFAREGSIRALRDQYQRLLQAAPIRSRPLGPVRRISSTPTLTNQSVGGRTAKSRGGRTSRVAEIQEDREERDTRDVRNGTVRDERDVRDEQTEIIRTERPDDIQESTSGMHMFDASGPLFCKYAIDLQERGGRLDDNFSKGGSLACPDCGTRIGIQPGRAWRIDKELVHEKRASDKFESDFIEERTYFINNRFIIKCHREGAGFACILCFKYRDSDTLCETAQRFVNHVWKKHSVAEYDVEPDIEERALFERRISKQY
jgi:hypothetical protein